MKTTISNYIIIMLGCVLISPFILNCSESKNNSSKAPNEETVQKSNTISNSNLTNLIVSKENIESRFSKIYAPEKISFNDGSSMDFQEDMNFDNLNDNFKPREEPSFEKYMSQFEIDSVGVVLESGKYHPTSIGKIALKAINNYKVTKSDYSKKVFLDQVQWAENNFYETENYGFWYFTEPAPLYHLEAGWTSAFSQGILLNVCLEAYRLTKEKKYASLIEKALKGFMVPIENGGFMRYWDENELWFEEYSTERPSRVINGTMYGLVGVYNVYKDLESELARKIFESGVNTIKNHLEDYDAKYTSRYSLADWKDEVSLEHYHEGHVIQLLWLYKVTGEEVFRKYAKIFLENDRGTFMVNSMYAIIKPKIVNISASHTIDSINHSTKNLTDEIWAYGNFWSSHRTAELTIDFGEKKQNVSALTLYHMSAQSKGINFKLYAYNDETKDWRFVQEFVPNRIKDKVSAYNITGKYETYIEHYKIFENADASKLKLVFDASADNIIALREINFIYDRSIDIEYLIKKLDELL